MKKTDPLPKHSQYVYIDFLYMRKEEKNTPARFIHEKKTNAGEPIFIFDFYSGTGYASIDKVIKWRPRTITYKGKPRAWATIQDGTDGLCA
jgi:hypothetical protein